MHFPVGRVPLALVVLLLVSACSGERLSEPSEPATLARKSQACTVVTNRELMITATSVVDDPLRTTWATDPASDPRAASWTFGRIMQKIAGPNDASAMVRTVLESWLVDQTIKGQVIAARTKMATKVINPWLAASGGGALDLRKAPFMLSAVVNRMDLQDLSRRSAGEGRLVFTLLTSVTGGLSLPMTVIFEFNLPAVDQAAVNQWAADWHLLGSLTLGSTTYNGRLGAIVDRFATQGNLLRFLTNEAAFDPATDDDGAAVQEFREFHLDLAGTLTPAPVSLTPANLLDSTAALASYINQNEGAILAGTHQVPASFEGAPFQGGAVFGPPNQEGPTGQRGYWKAPGVSNNDARHRFSLGTCNGCHNLPETGTGAVHVFRNKTRANRAAAAAGLSGFLTGISVADPVSGVLRSFNDLANRNAGFRTLVCP